MRVLRVYHAGRDRAHRARERVLAAAGVEVTLVVPRQWSEGGAEAALSSEPFEVVELDVRRSGDVNRHRYTSNAQVAAALARVRPDLLDLHEEPFSLACRQWLKAAGTVPTVAYTAQNVDKRFPPPFAQYERQALRRLSGMYPCSRQAASVARGKGFEGLLEVLPLGYDAADYAAGEQRADDEEAVLGLVGRLVPEKGVLDAVEVLAAVRRTRRARLVLAGSGPMEAAARERAFALGVAEHLTVQPWQGAAAMAELYRTLHVVLVPSSATQTWVEQFGRVIVEAQAAGAVVAAYASGAIPDVGGRAAVVVPEGDVAALSRAVTALLSDVGRYEELRQQGSRQVADLTWEAVGRRQAAFYDRALARPRTPLPQSARQRRAVATAEFGPPARLAGGAARPFAAPVLRRDTALTRALGRATDLADR